MSKRTITLDDRLYDYLHAVSLREPALLARLREETAALPEARMQIAPEQGQFMAMLVRVMNAREILEIGTFTGYSALAMALALPPDGHIVACDVSAEWTAIGRRYWREAGVAERIELRLAPAIETLEALLADGGEDRFDFAFIDADKSGYHAYYEACLKLVRPGGLIVVDNTLWDGRVADDSVQDANTCAIRAFNAALHDDVRVDLSLVPIGDGLTLARRRG
ncbi:MAG: class I SAM-dependent methyltransferase [Defluviicoccus sp.]|nr:class I SAM-dependent methyltransferase [Defluviicoccus sp.]MDG4609770.1 class I SAM-dependent methyltransferase [Defluviicoccus sp.]MDS4009947.1 class I SAM-dependent methyltransferase [Defluviicoccus sp.]